jgi:hypothetical protein
VWLVVVNGITAGELCWLREGRVMMSAAATTHCALGIMEHCEGQMWTLTLQLLHDGRIHGQAHFGLQLLLHEQVSGGISALSRAVVIVSGQQHGRGLEVALKSWQALYSPSNTMTQLPRSAVSGTAVMGTVHQTCERLLRNAAGGRAGGHPGGLRAPGGCAREAAGAAGGKGGRLRGKNVCYNHRISPAERMGIVHSLDFAADR